MKNTKNFQPHGEMTTNRQPIIMQDKGNIELIQEALPTIFSLESQVNLQGQVHHSPLDSVSILQHCSNDFDDVIGERLESSFCSMVPSNQQVSITCCFEPTL
jgi:hypothetical protein